MLFGDVETMPDFEDEYLDVLQNIEFAIVSVYRQNTELTDYDVDKVLNALIRAYQAEQKQRAITKPNLSALAEQVYAGVQSMCNWRLGRESMELGDHNSKMPAPEPITVEEVIACLKRIRKSIKRWGRVGGRQGYLQYIDQFIA